MVLDLFNSQLFSHASRYDQGLGKERIQDTDSRWGSVRTTNDTITTLKTINLEEWNRNDMIIIDGSATMETEGGNASALKFNFEGGAFTNASSNQLLFSEAMTFKLMIQSALSAAGVAVIAYTFFFWSKDGTSAGIMGELSFSATPDKTGFKILIRGNDNSSSDGTSFNWNVKLYKETLEDL